MGKIHVRHCMMYKFNFKKSVTQETKVICSAYKEDPIDVRTFQKWFAPFKTGDVQNYLNYQTIIQSHLNYELKTR